MLQLASLPEVIAENDEDRYSSYKQTEEKYCELRNYEIDSMLKHVLFRF